MEKYRNVDLNLFVAFDALLRHRNVSRAAESLGLSQGALSKSLNKLRQHFGDRLFLKTRDGVAPTDKALAMAPDVSRFMEFAQHSLVSHRPFDPATCERTITLSTTDMAEVALLPALMERLRAVAPGCRLRTFDSPGQEHRQLEEGEVDLVLTGPLKPGGETRQQKLFEHRYVVIAHRDCPLDDEITLEQFRQMDQVLVPPTRSHSVTLPPALLKLGANPKVFLTSPHWLVIPHMVACGPSFVAIAPLVLGELYKGMGAIKVLRPTFELPKIELLQYWHRRSDGDAFNIWLRATVREALFHNPSLHMR